MRIPQLRQVQESYSVVPQAHRAARTCSLKRDFLVKYFTPQLLEESGSELELARARMSPSVACDSRSDHGWACGRADVNLLLLRTLDVRVAEAESHELATRRQHVDCAGNVAVHPSIGIWPYRPARLERPEHAFHALQEFILSGRQTVWIGVGRSGPRICGT